MTQLFLVSAGPGNAELITPRSVSAIEAASDIVAYGLYIDLLGDLCRGKTHHDLPLGEEIGRARLALDLAASGKTTALVSSGDIGIYAMATLVFELLDNQLAGKEINPAWLDVDIQVIPGISAMQANSSSVGALLGHDFCTVSLSDLLTPWETIVKRVHSAGSGDFVVSFYNPVSIKWCWQLNTARNILLEYRPGTTPVVLGRNLTREDHLIRIITLDQLDAKDVDMFTCVSVGNSESKHIVNGSTNWVYTPPRILEKTMTVYFIGAGPSDPELITQKGMRLIQRCPVILYAGSLVPVELLDGAADDAMIEDTASKHLDEIIARIEFAHGNQQGVALVHSGDPSIYGAIGEQMRRLDELCIDYEIIPGVTAASASAAMLKREFTLSGVSQTVIYTRYGSKTPMPEKENLNALAQHGATLAIHLGVSHIHKIVKELEPHYGANCPVAVCYPTGWPDQDHITGTLADIVPKVRAKKITRTALILAGHALDPASFSDSFLYSEDKAHLYRPKVKPQTPRQVKRS